MRVPPGLAAQSRRQQVGFAEHRMALLQVVGRLPDRFQRREARRRAREAALRPVEPYLVRIPRKPECLGAGLPHRRQLARRGLVLPLPRMQRRRLRGLRVVLPALVRHVVEDVAPARRERLQHRRRVPRKLEARQPAHLGRNQHVAHLPQPPRQIVPVPRPDQTPIALEQRRLHAPPLARRVPRHVGDHRVRMELRVVVAARNVPEGRRHKTVRLHPRTPPGRGVVAPGLKELRLHPVQRRPHRRVVRPHHRLVVVKQRLQRHRLRRREGTVPARAVLVLAVHDPAEADIRARHMALEHGDEPAPAYPFRQAQRLRSPAVPAVGRTVRLVVPHQVLVQQVVRRFRRGSQRARAREHPSVRSVGGPPGCGRSGRTRSGSRIAVRSPMRQSRGRGGPPGHGCCYASKADPSESSLLNRLSRRHRLSRRSASFHRAEQQLGASASLRSPWRGPAAWPRRPVARAPSRKQSGGRYPPPAGRRRCPRARDW